MNKEERRYMTSHVCEEIKSEMERAESIHGPFHSLHEALAVIREEYLELEEAIFWGVQRNENSRSVRSEAIQLAAMATRLAVTVTPPACNLDPLEAAEREAG